MYLKDLQTKLFSFKASVPNLSFELEYMEIKLSSEFLIL